MEHPVKQHLVCLALISAAVLSGCAREKQTTKAPPVAPLPAGSFAREWFNPLQLDKQSVAELHVRGDTLFAYTDAKTVYAIGRTAGQLL